MKSKKTSIPRQKELKDLEKLIRTKEGLFTLDGRRVEEDPLTKPIQSIFRHNEKSFFEAIYKNPKRPKEANAYETNDMNGPNKKEIPIHIEIKYYKI